MPNSCTVLSEAPAMREDAAPVLSAGSLPLAVVLDPRTMLLFGWLASAPPETATVSFGEGAAHGAWRATIWAGKTDDSGPRHFLAVLQAENIVRAQTMPMVLVSKETGAPLELPPIARIELDAAPLLAPLRDATADLATIFDFLKSVLVAQSPQQPRSPRLYDFLLEFLGAISMHDGFVEILGRPDCGGLLLQGWSVHLEAGTLDFGLLCPGLDLHEAAVASFERSDLLSTARGLVAFMKTARDVDPNTLSRLYFKSQGTYYHLDVVDNRLVLEDRQAIAQLKDMIGRLRGPVTAVRALKRVCRPRFGGHETVSALAAPVRLAQDTALYAPGAGVFVSGWLLDPCRAVCLVLLKSTRNFYARLDQTWVRLPRPDVTASVRGQPDVRRSPAALGTAARIYRLRAASAARPSGRGFLSRDRHGRRELRVLAAQVQ